MKSNSQWIKAFLSDRVISFLVLCAFFIILCFLLDVPIRDFCEGIPKNIRKILKGLSPIVSPTLHLVIWATGIFIVFLTSKLRAYRPLLLHLNCTLVITLGVVKLLKWVLGRARPDLSEKIYGFHFFQSDHHFHSFPSGHSATAFAVASVLSYFYPNYKKYFFFFAALLSILRILLNYHYISDVLFGGLIGYFCFMAITMLLKKMDPLNFAQSKG